MIKKTFQKAELIFFLIFSIISILPFFLVKYVPSLDGPQHLYTARLISELIRGNEFISQYFRFNPVIVGNMSSLYIMALLMFAFPAWLAEKIFLSFYVIGLALSFRYFIRSVQKHDSLIYLLIFPFAFTSLFMLGYYNFSVAFIPFFSALGYLKRHETSLGMRKVVFLAILCLLIYLSHAVVFVFFGLIMFLQLVFDLGYPMINQAFGMKRLIPVIKKYLIILISAIPAIVLWGLYYLSINSGSQDSPTLSFQRVKEVLGELYRLRILVGFHHGQEVGSNYLMFWILTGLILMTIIPMHRYFPRIFRQTQRNNPESLKWTFIVIILFLLAIFFPDRMVTGSMSLRLCILFFLGVITWISLQSFPKSITLISLILIIGAFTWHRTIIYQYYYKINKDITVVENAGKFIKPQTILYPVYCSESWVHPHFHCYLGVDKPLVNLGNPQTYGQMPLMWNNKNMPNILLGKLDQKQSGVYWASGNNYFPPVSADYIFIWRRQCKEDLEEVTTLLNKIEPYYSQTFRSSNDNVLLYNLKNQN